jgi:hypothetical protein
MFTTFSIQSFLEHAYITSFLSFINSSSNAFTYRLFFFACFLSSLSWFFFL